MRKARFVLAIIMVVAMLFTTLAPAVAITTDNRAKRTSASANLNKREEAQSESEKKLEGLSKVPQDGSRFDRFNVDDDALVTVIITFDGVAAVKTTDDINSKAAQATRAALKNKQNAFFNSLDFDAELKYNYTVLMNGIAITTAYKNVAALENIKGVSGVYIANSYDAPQEMPQMSYANDITGASELHQAGFTGDGIVVAVLDTGLAVEHEAFKDYGIIGAPTLTEEMVAATDTVMDGQYLSCKVPYAYDYYDMDADVSDSNGHGTHVSGTAVGYVEAEDGAVTFSGAAPASQLLSMKVFSSDPEQGGTNSSIYFAALEDAYLLGADVINMSLGAANGFTYDAELEDEVYGNIYQTLEDAGVIMCVSAGNEYSMGYSALNYASLYYGQEWVLADYADYGTVGSPSTYEGNLSIASSENTAYPTYCIKVGENYYSLIDSCEDEALKFVKNFGGQELDYVIVPNVGSAEDYDTIDATGKIAVISRGDITFEEKVENAANAGAIGAVVYNNADGTISMSIETFEIPAVSVQQDAGAALIAAASNGVGSFELPEEMVDVANENAGLMSDFSSWGVTSDLRLKPQLTAPGGMIYSSVNGATAGESYMLGDANLSGEIEAADAAAILRYVVHLQTLTDEQLFKGDITQNGSTDAADAAGILRYIVHLQNLPYYTVEGNSAYDVYSGTSMAAPNATGNFATLLETVKHYFPEMTKQERAAFAESLVLSTADILVDAEEYEYSPRKQGAGELNVVNAISTGAFILDPIVELGDDPSRDGVYTVSFEVKNICDISLYYGINTTTLMDYIYSLDGTNYNTLTSDHADVTVTTNWVNDIVIVPAGETVTVEVTITLSQEQKDTFDAVFANGAFVEGYVVLNAEFGADLHATFLAFYGDWRNGNILESYDFTDVIDAEEFLNNNIDTSDTEGLTYAQNGYTYADLFEMNVGFNEAYAWGLYNGEGQVGYLGDNIFDYFPSNSSHNAISNELSEVTYLSDGMVSFPTQIRNARHLIMVVSDSQTGEIYYVDDTPYLGKAYYEADYDMYLQQGTFVWDGTDMSGDYVPTGTTAMVNYYAWLDYDDEAEASYQAINGDYSLLNEDYIVWNYPVTVDIVAPTLALVSWDATTKMLTVNASDDQYLQLVALYNSDWEFYDGVAFSDDETAQSHLVQFDLSAYSGDIAYISPMDYATNWPDWTFDLTTGELTEGASGATGDYSLINDICDDIYNGATEESYTTCGIVTFVDGRNVYIEALGTDVTENDYNYGICLYCAEAPTNIGIGDVIMASGEPATYHGLYELSNATIDDTLYVEEGEWEYYWCWSYNAIADVSEYIDAFACTPIAYGMDDEGNVSIDNGLTIVSVQESSTAGYYNIVVTDGTTEMSIYKCPTPENGIDEFRTGAIIGGYLVASTYDGAQFRAALPEDIWVLQASTEPIATATPTPSADPSGLPYFVNTLTSNGVELEVGQTSMTIVTSTGADNPATATANTDKISITPWHGINNFNIDTGYTYIFFTADLTGKSDLTLAGVFNGNGRVPTEFKAQYKIGDGEYSDLGVIAVAHNAGVVPAAAVNWSFEVPAACEGQSSVTFRVRQTVSATNNSDGTSTSDAGALYMTGFGLTSGSPVVEPTPTASTPTPGTGSGLAAGTYKISATVGGVTYYMTNTVNLNKFTSTTDASAATVWTLEASGTGWLIKDPTGSYVMYSGTADSNKTNFALGTTGELFTYDELTGYLNSSTIAGRALACNGGNNSVFGNYALQNTTNESYQFVLTFTAA